MSDITSRPGDPPPAPRSGGSYLYDPKTGELRPAAAAAPAPQPSKAKEAGK